MTEFYHHQTMERKQDFISSFLCSIICSMICFFANPAVGQNFYPNNRLNYYNMDTTGALAEKPDYSWINHVIWDLCDSIRSGKKIEIPQFPKETFYNPALIIPLTQLKDTQIQNILSEMIYMTMVNHLAPYQDSISHGIFTDISFSMGYSEELSDTIDDFPQMVIHVRSNLHMMATVIEYKKKTDSLFAFYLDSILCIVKCSSKAINYFGTYLVKAFEDYGEKIKIHCCGRSTFFYASHFVDSMKDGRGKATYIPIDGLCWSFYWKNKLWNDTKSYETYQLRDILIT